LRHQSDWPHSESGQVFNTQSFGGQSPKYVILVVAVTEDKVAIGRVKAHEDLALGMGQTDEVAFSP
jgi:hypothetical protein